MEILLHPAEQKFLVDQVRSLGPSSVVTEWGSGGSTILMLNNMVDDQRLISIEHSEKWWNKVTELARGLPEDVAKRLIYHHVPTGMPYEAGADRDAMDLRAYTYSTPAEELPTYNRAYINPYEGCFHSDLYLVDGISRGACLATIYAKASNRDAVVLLHDHTGREEWYSWATSLYKTAEKGPDNFLVLRMK